jgi:hypothetical protein
MALFWLNFLKYHPLTEDTKYEKGVTFEEIRSKNRTVHVRLGSTGLVVRWLTTSRRTCRSTGDAITPFVVCGVCMTAWAVALPQL